MISKQLREADRKLTALENDVKAVRLIQRMNRDEQERLAIKLLLLKAQMILSRHGEFQVADEIGDFLSTPFASTEGKQVSCGVQADRADTNTKGKRYLVGSETARDRPRNDALVEMKSAPSAGIIFPRPHPSNAGGGVVHRGARPRPEIHLCNKERKSIVRSAEERGK